MSPGENAGRMLPESTVTGRYQPVRGSRPRPTSAARASTSASCARAAARRRGTRRSATGVALLSLEIPADTCVGYRSVAARCVPVNAYVTVDDWFWNVLPAPLGSVSVTRRWSVEPAVVALRFESARFVPITAREASTVDVVPPQVYV